MKKIYEQSYKEIKENLNEGKISSLEICENFLERINQVESQVKAFLSIDKDKILEQAKISDKRRKESRSLSQFDGLPIAIKDNICIEGEITSCASKFLENYKSPFSATVIEKLQNKGFIFFPRANMDEFAMGSTTENSAFQVTTNPFDKNKVCGGSSGGSAASVGASMVPISLGSDTGGSVRMPASFCGVFGLKPTYGRVSRYGLVAYASSLDQIGPISNDLEGIKDIFEVISGEDIKDNTSLKSSSFSTSEPRIENLENKSVGVMSDRDLSGVDSEVQEKYKEVLCYLKKQKVKLVELDFSFLSYCVPVYYIIASSECSSNLSRFDGIRYGVRSEADNLQDLYLKSRTEGFGEEVKRRILTGTFALSSGYYDAFYAKSQKTRVFLRKQYENFFKEVDLILQPTCTNTAFKIGEKANNPVQMYKQDVLTVTANLTGIPALNIPIGLGKDSKMPIGLQLSANHFGENKLFSFAKFLSNEENFKVHLPS